MMRSSHGRTPEEAAAHAAVRADRDRRAEQLERRLAVPVVVAAVASVPAVFLITIGDGVAALVGTALNWASLSVLTIESMVLFVVTGDRIAWIKRHKWTLFVTATAVPGVIFALAPVQVLRVVLRVIYTVGALHVLRANRIVKAGRVLARRVELAGPWRYLPIAIGAAVAAGFVALILADRAALQSHLAVLTEVTNWLLGRSSAAS